MQGVLGPTKTNVYMNPICFSFVISRYLYVTMSEILCEFG